MYAAASLHMEDTNSIPYHVNSIPHHVNSLLSAVGVKRELLQEKWLVKKLHKFLPPSMVSSQYSLAPPLMLLQQLLLPFFPPGMIVTPLSSHELNKLVSSNITLVLSQLKKSVTHILRSVPCSQ